MRHSLRSTLSSSTAASGSTVASGLHQRTVRIILLNKEELSVNPESKARVRDIFRQVCDYVGLREMEYFGLAQRIDGEFHFLDQETKLVKLLPKGWKNKNDVAITFYLKVQHYVRHVSILREKVTRQQYYLQLKENLLNHNQFVSEEKCFVLAGYALQADFGNRTDSVDSPTCYFDPREYFPAWVLEERGMQYIKQHLPTMHSDLCGMTRFEATMNFIKDVCLPPHAHNLHFYKLKKRKTDDAGSAWLAICPSGVQIYEQQRGFKSLLSTFAWPDIKKLHAEKKKFEIRAEGASELKFLYYVQSEEQGKHLLWLCRNHHQFQMNLQPRMAELRTMEAEDRRYKETYIYSENTEFSWSDSHASANSSQRSTAMAAAAVTPKPQGNGQRVSVISSASSNTTSGIVSDRMHASLDDSEEEARGQQEIIIDSPPAPSAASSYGSLWTSTPQSLHGISPIATPGAVPAHPNASSRNNSARSMAFTPTAVDAHVERVTLATPMTVSSNPVHSNPQRSAPRPEFSTPISRPFDFSEAQWRENELHRAQLQRLENQQQLQRLENQQQLQAQLQEDALHREQLIQAQLRHQHLQHLQQQLETAQAAFQQSMYGSMELTGQQYNYSPRVDGYSRSVDGLHQMGHVNSPTYENIPALQKAVNTPEVNRLRGGSQMAALTSLPCTPQTTRAMLADMARRRSSTVAAVGHPSRPLSVTPSVTRAKSSVTPSEYRPPVPEQKVASAQCPVHGAGGDKRNLVVDEILGKNVSLPLLTALCNDSSLMNCTCSTPAAAAATKRMSYAQPPSVRQLMQPGTQMRPMSWHSEHRSLEQMLNGASNLRRKSCQTQGTRA